MKSILGASYKRAERAFCAPVAPDRRLINFLGRGRKEYIFEWPLLYRYCTSAYKIEKGFKNFFLQQEKFSARQGTLRGVSNQSSSGQGCQHYRFFRRSAEFRKWSVFLQIFIRSFEIFDFLLILKFFDFFQHFLIGNHPMLRPCSSWTANW